MTRDGAPRRDRADRLARRRRHRVHRRLRPAGRPRAVAGAIRVDPPVAGALAVDPTVDGAAPRVHPGRAARARHAYSSSVDGVRDADGVALAPIRWRAHRRGPGGRPLPAAPARPNVARDARSISVRFTQAMDRSSTKKRLQRHRRRQAGRRQGHVRRGRHGPRLRPADEPAVRRQGRGDRRRDRPRAPTASHSASPAKGTFRTSSSRSRAAKPRDLDVGGRRGRRRRWRLGRRRAAGRPSSATTCA